MTTVYPLRGKVYVTRTALEEVSAGGIVLKKSVTAEPTGIVRAVGAPKLELAANGQWVEVPCELAVGQTVGFNSFAAPKAQFGMGDNELCIGFEDIICIISDSSDE